MFEEESPESRLQAQTVWDISPLIFPSLPRNVASSLLDRKHRQAAETRCSPSRASAWRVI